MLAIAIFIYNNKTINDTRNIENMRSVIISFPWERNVVEQWEDFEFQTLQSIFSISSLHTVISRRVTSQFYPTNTGQKSP
jgi:hypothetical protein